MSVYQKISAVTAALAENGISKDQTNTFDKYKFRGIDDVYNALAPVIAELGLVILPRVRSSELKQVQTSQGKPANHCRVMVEYVFVDAESEPDSPAAMTTVVVPGEASDRGDKAENKAMSAAFKLMAFQTFCVPTEGGSADSEEESIEHVEEVISPDEAAEVRRMLDLTGTGEQEYCQYLKLDSIESIPAHAYAKVINQLGRKYERMEQTSGQHGAPAGEDMG